MKVRVTLMAINNVPASRIGENPEEKIKKAWEALIALCNAASEYDENSYVEKVELLDEV